MAYTKTQWVDNDTDIDKDNLNKIEQGIYDNSLVADAVTNTLNPTDTETYKTAELTEGQITDVIGVSDIVIKGNTEQDGTPTPSAPVDVNVVSGSNVINTSNKNLFIPTLKADGTSIFVNNATVSLIKDEYTFIASGYDMYLGNVFSNGNTYNGTRGFLMTIPTNATNIYIKLTNTAFSKNYINFYDENKISLGYVSFGATRNIAVVENAKYCTLRIGAENSVSGTTYKTKVMVSTMNKAYVPHQGKELPLDLPVENLFDKDNSSLVFNGFANRSSLKLESNASAKTICQPCKPNTTYTISKILSARFFVDETSSSTISNGISITPLSTGSSSNVTSYTVTTSANAKYLLVYYYVTTADTLSEEKIRSSIQIEQGSKANAYTPYGTDPIELCKIGDYQDYFYKSGSKWYLHKEIGKTIFNGSEAWSYSVNNLFFYTDALILSKPDSNLFCDRFSKVANTTTYANMNTGEIKYDGVGSRRIIIKYTDLTSATDFKTWLASNNTKVYYPLATATNTEITDTTLISQLEAIYNAPLYEQTNITQTNNDLPMVLDITACKNNINGIKAFIRK